MITGFKEKEAEKVFKGEFSKKLPQKIQDRARELLIQLHFAKALSDLLIPPSNRFEQLKGRDKGKHSLRINKQYRVIFKWKDGSAYDVEIDDYHKKKRAK